MNDLIRSGIYTGLGSLVLARRKLEELVEELIQNNELTQDEGRRIVQEIIHKAEDIRNEAEQKMLNAIDEVLMNSNLPARNEIEVKIQEVFDVLNQLRTRSLFSGSRDEGKDKPVAG
jgi:polyhydroxyalkanoate synthesis regulator phasin